jgi:hypothetical protein
MEERRKQGDDLTGRRNGYAALKKDLQHFFKEVWVVVVLIGVVCTVALAGFGIFLRHQDQTAKEFCQNQNIRHDNAIYSLIAGSNQDQLDAPTDAARTDIRRRRDVTIGIIEAIAPKTDCSDSAKVKAIPEVTPIPELP